MVLRRVQQIQVATIVRLWHRIVLNLFGYLLHKKL